MRRESDCVDYHIKLKRYTQIAPMTRRQALECFATAADEPESGFGSGRPTGTMQFASFLMCICEMAQHRYGDRENDGWSDADKGVLIRAERESWWQGDTC